MKRQEDLNKSSDRDDEGGKKSWSNILKKVASVSVGSSFMSEELISKLLQDIPLPKEFLVSLMDNAKRSKQEFVESLSKEIGLYLKQVSPKELVNFVLTNYDLELKGSIKFKPKKKK